jgi:hypothetical protein
MKVCRHHEGCIQVPLNEGKAARVPVVSILTLSVVPHHAIRVLIAQPSRVSTCSFVLVKLVNCDQCCPTPRHPCPERAALTCQYLYFCTRQASKLIILTLSHVPQRAIRVLSAQPSRVSQYLYFCTSKAGKLSTLSRSSRGVRHMISPSTCKCRL